jgi:hypothetical protein
VLETAKLLVRMEARGYNMGVLRTKLHRHVTRFYYFVGAMSPGALTADVWNKVDDLQALRADNVDWEHLAPASSAAEQPLDYGDTDSELKEMGEVFDP